MNINWQRLTIYGLIAFTLIAGAAALFVSTQLQKTPTTTPTNTQAVSCTAYTAIKCKVDDNTICQGNSTNNPVFNAALGQAMCTTGGYGDCEVYDACAPHVVEGQSCTSTYIDLTSQQIIRFSSVQDSRGAFVGCDAQNQMRNCFCDESVSVGNGFTGGTVKCFDDTSVNGAFNVCGARSGAPSITITVTPEVTISPSVSPTITTSPSVIVTTTPTATPTATATPTMTATPTVPVTVTSLPDTALISDELDMVFLGLILVITGLWIYVLDLHINTYRFFYNSLYVPFAIRETTNRKKQNSSYDKKVNKDS